MSSEESIACLEEKAPDTDEKSPTRITWARPSEFLLNVAGYNVGLGNVWRFSYLCYKNGGGAFLIPYLLVAAFCGLPLLFQEVAMGQFTRHGCIRAWVPMMQGIGYSTLLLCIFFLIYFAVVMAWCIFYLVHSFTIGTLPWCTCDNWWNSDACVNTVSSQVYINNTIKSPNSSTPANASTSVEEFWNNYVLQKTDGLGDLGSLTNWRMVLCYVFSWLVCYACIVKGIKTTGKVAYVTVSFPYIIMAILLVRGLTLEGAVDGVLFYITPDLHRLVDSQVWLDGASQVLYSLGVCYGILYGYGSYNKASTDCYRMAFYSVAICCGSSICFGFVIFSFIGHMASETGKNVTEVTEGGLL